MDNFDNVQHLAVATNVETIVMFLSEIGVAHKEDIAPSTARIIALILETQCMYGSPIHATVSAELLGKGFFFGDRTSEISLGSFEGFFS